MSLTKYFLAHGSLEFMVDSDIASICMVLSAAPIPFREQKVGTKSRLNLDWD